MDEFRGIILQGHQAMRILAPDGAVLLDKADDGNGGRPEVQRGDLRRMLLDSLPVGAVQWGRKVVSTRSLGEGRHEVIFADDSTISTCLLVGADGAWSRVRPLLSDATPGYTGMSYIETYLFDVDTRHPATAQAVGSGSMAAPAAGGKGIQAQREKGGTIHTYVVLREPQEWFDAVDFADSATAAARIAKEERVPGVTLLGDAAHLLTPNGEGANSAMYDGAELGKAIAAHPGDIETALTQYEEAMFPRSAEFGSIGAELHDLDDDAAAGLIKLYTETLN
jgi:2-polyprenyl-6-methoxyphenol hydroxylase-like FAD-dependent oxidoreductase